MKTLIDNSDKKLSVLVIGCGNIAGGFDLHNENKEPLTHAQAYYQDNRYNLKACIDPNREKLLEFKNKWGFENIYSSLNQIDHKSDRFDVISICSPTSIHEESLEFAIKASPKLVFCEKPITDDIAKTQSLIDIYKKNNIPLAVNFTRRWMSDIHEFSKDLKSRKWGKIRSIVGHYNKGLLNNGSHLIDLIHFLAGPLEINYVGKPVFDHSEHDPSIPAILESEDSVPIYLNVTNSNDYSFFEIDFYMEKGIIQLTDGGRYWKTRAVEDSKEFSGYKSLGKTSIKESGYKLAMKNAVDNIFNSILKNDKLLSDASTAIETHKICSLIKEKAIS
ncbi:Gfo/Idh/MocA family oxidoreductase [Gammaproteobacteria bacterium]|nr:Gfo/Idh/MocA family oxidoreductase [Gammaproteobacteria bacterium]